MLNVFGIKNIIIYIYPRFFNAVFSVESATNMMRKPVPVRFPQDFVLEQCAGKPVYVSASVST